MQNIVTLGEINDALKFTTVTAAQLAEMGFAALANKPICEALPQEEARRLRTAKLYPAESIGQIRVALAKRLAAPASCLHQIQEPAPVLAAPADGFAATPAADAPLPLLVRDIAREFGITCAETCLALKPLGNFSTNTAVTAEMMAKLRECFPERVPASEVAGARERMTAGRACYFMERFLKEEKLLGPNEQAALHFVIEMLEAAAAPVVLPEPDAAIKEVMGLVDSLGVAATCFGVYRTMNNPEQSSAMQEAKELHRKIDAKLRALLAGVSAPAARESGNGLLPCPFCGGTAHFDIDDDNWEWVECAKCGMQGNRSASLMEDCKPKLIEAWNRRAPALQAQADARDADGMYYLQDARWSAMVGNCPSFWRLGGGYTTSLDDAERFTLEAAMKQHKCRETDLPWLCSELDSLRRPTIDCQYMPRSWDDQRAAIAAQAAQQGGDKQ